MDIEIVVEALAQQLENNNIKRGTKHAHEFEYAFVTGVLAGCAALNMKPPVYLVMCAISGRSIFAHSPSSDEVH